MMYDEMLSLEKVKQEPFIIENIKWDLKPKDLMEPRTAREEIKGYVFYIDTMGDKPTLFLIRHTAMEFAETLARIDEIPQELLTGAIEENKDKAYFGMYPINSTIEAWLKKELGVLTER